MNASLCSDMTTGSAISQDGTSIGYLRVGQGPAAAVILLHGSMQSARSHSQLALALADTKFLRPALDELASTLPHSKRVEFAGLDHGGTADASKANPVGKPEAVAAELKSFLAER